ENLPVVLGREIVMGFDDKTIQQGPSDAVSSGEAVYQDTPDALSGGRFNPDLDVWREGYLYTSKLDRKDYERDKRQIQIEMIKMQLWVKETGQKVLVIFEGREAAGKGGAIKRFNEPLNPRGARIVALEKPTEEESSQWYFQRYIQ